ncbi:MAG: mevalonate kinase [Holosporales bacterium]|jgi:mevalonate kinase|nr:mevalonate kinase [Holosporales bacterium]
MKHPPLFSQPLHAQACGKLILIGEHAVVYGHPAIALSLPQLHLDIHSTLKDPSSNPILWETQMPLSEEERHKMDAAFVLCLNLFATEVSSKKGIEDVLKENPPLLKMRSSLPLGAGLGGSAAFSIALTRLCAQAFGVQLTRSMTQHYAQQLEFIFHHAPSGIDIEAILAEAPIFFQKNKSVRPIPFFPSCWIVLIDTQERTPTCIMIDKVQQHLTRNPKDHQHLDSIGSLVQNVAAALEEQNLECVGAYLTQAHEHLRIFDISTPALDRAVKALRDNGALGAKLTGGGGGGIAFGLFLHQPNILPFDKYGNVLLLNFMKEPCRNL